MKALKIISIGNSIAIILVIYMYIMRYFPSLLTFSNEAYVKKGGDFLTEDLFSILLLYGTLVLFYIFNIGLLIWAVVRKNNKIIAVALLFTILMIATQIGMNHTIQHKKTQVDKERVTWTKNVKVKTFHSKNMPIKFTYTEKTVKGDTVFVTEKPNEIHIYTDGHKQRADRIISFEKDPKLSLSHYLTELDKDLGTSFYLGISVLKNQKNIVIVEIDVLKEETLKRHTGLSFADFGITASHQIDKVYAIQNKKRPSHYYVIILIKGNDRANSKANENVFFGEDWYHSMVVIN